MGGALVFVCSWPPGVTKGPGGDFVRLGGSLWWSVLNEVYLQGGARSGAHTPQNRRRSARGWGYQRLLVGVCQFRCIG